MKLYPECYGCSLKRTLLEMEGSSEEDKIEAVKRLCQLFIETFGQEMSTIDLYLKKMELLKDLIHDGGGMKEYKKESLRRALELYPLLKKYVDSAKNEQQRLEKALKVSLVGNTVEHGALDHDFDLQKMEEEVEKLLEKNPSVDNTLEIIPRIQSAKEILFITDNAAELIFDKILIEELTKHTSVTVSPLSKPAQDDATIEEVREAGLDSLARIVPRGEILGVVWEKTTSEFQKAFQDADFIIAKGMACYETLIEYPEKTGGRVALLFQAKCSPVANDSDVELGSLVMRIQ
ncbi:DUF89 domain-containing protein [Candidatus Altiarchaeota archaeon]